MVSYDKYNKTWSGAKVEPFYHPDCSIGQIIFKKLKNYPNDVLQISDTEGTTLKSHEALTAAIRIAQHIQKMGLRHDDVIGIVALNTTYLMPLVVGCLFNCTPLNSVNGSYDDKTMTYIFGLTKPRLIFCDGQFYEKVRAATISFKPTIYTVFDHIEGVPSLLDLLKPTTTESSYRPQPLTTDTDQTMAIICSSGTTGLPKAICIANSRMNVIRDFITNEFVIFCTTSIDWITGLWFVINNCVYGCKRIITDRPFSPEYFAEIVRKHKVIVVVIPPPIAVALAKCPAVTSESMASLKFIGIAGGFVSLATSNTLQSIAKNALVDIGYGTSEVGSISSTSSSRASLCVGKLVPGMRARIVDDAGKNLGPNEVGEIYLDHGHSWSGYYGNPKESLRSRDLQGWFHTGDLGYFDDQNNLYIVDRKKDILKYHGLHAWPAEIEECIREIPQVEDVCVVSIYDESCGDKAGALVVKTKDSALNENDVKDYVTKKLILPHKQLNAGVIFVEKLPINANGKLLKRLATEEFVASLNRSNREV